MISLVDDTYYERAWCAVEVTLMRALMETYGLHQWWEYSNSTLRKGDIKRAFDISSLKLTNEKLDRPKIDFLMRQSKLLGGIRLEVTNSCHVMTLYITFAIRE